MNVKKERPEVANKIITCKVGGILYHDNTSTDPESCCNQVEVSELEEAKHILVT